MEGQTQYLPIQSISYEFGSKFVSGYFVQEAATCSVALMIIGKSDPEAELTTTATRVRLVLNPGQIAGLERGGLFQSYLRREREDDDRRLRQQGKADGAPGARAPRRFDDIISGSLTESLQSPSIAAGVAQNRVGAKVREQCTGGTSASARVSCGMTSRSLCKRLPVPDRAPHVTCFTEACASCARIRAVN